MGTLAAAYAIAWGVLCAYVVWLASRSRQLAKRLENLERASSEHNAGLQNKRAA